VGLDATDAVRTHVRKILRAHDAYHAGIAARAREIEAKGMRLVEGGQTGGYDEQGNAPWEITDWRRGVLLASGNRLEAYEQAMETAADGEVWCDIEAVHDEDSLSEAEPTDGVPGGLAEALEAWVDGSPDLEEIAGFVGWSLEEVESCFVPAQRR
jgi:hypothetical protein